MNITSSAGLVSWSARALLAILAAVGCGCQTHGPDLISDRYLSIEVDAPPGFEVEVTAHEKAAQLVVHGTVSAYRRHEDAALDVSLRDPAGERIATRSVELVHAHFGSRSRAPFSVTFPTVPPRGTTVQVRYRRP